ncbi:MAG: hypothetical protein QOJ16_2458 [Acidobacteriota bacterium]|jgi:hypothetical protein|nr:hypothetical protein [Acidobacteriota bacterium]
MLSSPWEGEARGGEGEAALYRYCRPGVGRAIVTSMGVTVP